MLNEKITNKQNSKNLWNTMKHQHYCMHNKKQTKKTSKAQWSSKTIMCMTKNKHPRLRQQRKTQHWESKDKCNIKRWRDNATNKNELH
jgi:hypothetical protein